MNILKNYDVRLSSNIIERDEFFDIAHGLGEPTMRILGKRFRDIMSNGLTGDNKISSEDLTGFSRAVYKNSKRFRKFCKRYFQRVNTQLSEEKPEAWLKYHLSGVKNPLVVYKELGGKVEYDVYKRSFIKTLSQVVLNFIKCLWVFFKHLMRKIINMMPNIKVSVD